MKEYYFTPDNIDQKSCEILESVEKFRERRKVRFIPENSALLIIDMQEFFLDESSHAFIPSALSIVQRIKNLLFIYEKAGQPIIFTRHINSQENAGLMGKWWKDLILENDNLSRILNEFDFSKKSGMVINKTQYDGFYNTELENELRAKNITQIVVTGVMTHLCCETTIRSAFVRGFESFFPVDGTATYNEDFHKAAFLSLSHGFCVPVCVKEIYDYMELYLNGY